MNILNTFVIFSVLVYTPLSIAATNQPKTATPTTELINSSYLKSLPFDNQEDFIKAEKGLIARPKELIIKNNHKNIVWNINKFTQFQGVNATAPVTVNPSLWRQARLNSLYGLYKVTEQIYQVRGYDLSVMSIIEGKTGYIVIDPLISTETAKAAMDYVYSHLGKKPIHAVIYTHSHVDHFGGVKGIINEEDVKSGKIKVIAPEGFIEHVISENVMAGNAMSRRAMYMYGSLLPISAIGQVDSGLGKTTSRGTVTLIEPTDIIKTTGTTLKIDGIDLVFQYTPNTEAPSEMNIFFPQFKALCIAENAVATMHNLYTLRGAQVRDAKSWVNYFNETLKLYGKNMEVVFASHNWPTWGNQQAIQFIENQRDLYKYLHDQTLRLANMGYTMNEIAEMMVLPKSLATKWYNRPYYGTVNHNVKAVFNKYLGWFDGNPANLHPLPEVEASKQYVEYMGGEDAILKKAKADYDLGKYRWVAEVVNKIVFANPKNQAARELLADTYEQLGYQAESAPWRNFYLSGAQELREGVISTVKINGQTSQDIVSMMPLESFFDYMAIKLKGPEAEDKVLSLKWKFPDTNNEYFLIIKNSVFHYFDAEDDQVVDAEIIMDREVLNNIILHKTTAEQAYKNGKIKIIGDPKKLKEFFGLFQEYNTLFNIVTP